MIQLEKLDRVEIVKGTLFSSTSFLLKNTSLSAIPTTPQSPRRIEWPKNNPNTITFATEKETNMYQFHFANKLDCILKLITKLITHSIFF